jgi:peptide/nickel transport system substrate-binding protein
LGLLSACSSPTPKREAAARPVELLAPTEPFTLDPRFATRALDVRLTRLVHAGLVTLDPDTLEPKPYLASHLERDSETTLVIHLRANLRFHSGAPLRPEDVCATLSALSEPALMSPHRTIVDSFVNCRVRGPLTLSLDLKRPRATWMTDLEIPILRADEARAPQRPSGNLDGLGPFRISSHGNNAIALTPVVGPNHRTPRYPIVVRTVEDENVRAMRLLSDKAELAPNAFSPSLLSGFRGENAQVRSRPGANITYLLINNARPPFEQGRVRRALSAAIDRDAVTVHLLSGYARPAKWLIPDGHWAAPRNAPRLRFDRAEAARVLSGLEATTLLTSTDRNRVLQARAVGQMLSDAGLPTQIVPLELGILLSRLDKGQFTLAILQIPELTEPNILRWFFHPRAIDNAAEGRNRARYRNAAVGDLLDRASMEFRIEQRRELYVELARIMLEDMPVVPLWHEDHVVVSRQRGDRFLPSAEGRWAALAEL